MKELIKEQIEKEKRKLERTPSRLGHRDTLEHIGRLARILRDLEVAEAAARYPWMPVDTNKCGPR